MKVFKVNYMYLYSSDARSLLLNNLSMNIQLKRLISIQHKQDQMPLAWQLVHLRGAMLKEGNNFIEFVRSL